MLNARDTDWLQGFGQECDGHWDRDHFECWRTGGQGTLDLEAYHEGSAVLAPLSVHIVERSKSLHIFLGIVPLMINGEPKKKKKSSWKQL